MDKSIVESELTIRTSRSSGAGGQHVNKTETRVEVVFDLANSQGLTDREKKHIKYHHKRMVDENGFISVVDQSGRSQYRNRVSALRRLMDILGDGRKPIPKKHKGKAFVANRRKRLEGKKRRSEIKANRGKIIY